MKKFVVYAAAFLAVTLVFGCVRMAIVKKSYKKDPPLPTLEGTLRLPGLNGPVDVYRDAYGVPHIFTEDEHDLFYAIGYVQAQDRLWEMCLLRAVAEGRLSELFGNIGVPGDMEVKGFKLSTVGMDERQRIIGMKHIGHVGEALLERADPHIHGQLEAYCDGVNTFIGQHREWKELPIEFQVLKVRPEPITIADIMSANLMLGQMLAGNMGAELARYGLFKEIGEDKGWDFAPLHYSPGPTIVPPELLENKLASPRGLPPGGRPSRAEMGYGIGDLPSLSRDAAAKILLAEHTTKKALYYKYPYCSNNWIVSPKLSATGNAMLCNDPHLSHIQPSLVYLMHIKGAGFDCFGATFPGMPFLVLAHTRKLAWGETTTAADVQDLFIETVDPDRPGRYKYKGEWRDFTVREEVIRIKTATGFKEKRIEIKQSIHGPIINDIAGELPEGTPPVALRWVAWDFSRDLSLFERLIESETPADFLAKVEDHELTSEAIMSGAHMFNIAMKGESIEDMKRALDKLVLPNQSWVAADAEGNIMYLPGGLVPTRGKGIGVMPVPGESGEYDWTGFIPLMELPHAINPGRGYMATGNNEVVDSEWYPYVFATNYGDGWRAWRIEELIKELAPLDMDDMKRIQNDVKLKEAEWYVPRILAAVDNKKPSDPATLRAADALRDWDFEADLDSTATVIFFVFKSKLKKNVLEDEVDKDVYESFLGRSGFAVTMWMDRGESEYFDDKRTDETEDMDDMLVKSLGDAMREVEKEYGKDPDGREWGELHTIRWFHPLGFGPLEDMSVGPFPHLGASGTVRNAGHAGFGKKPWKALGGPVLRHIMDMGDPDNAQIVIDGSQSGQWLSPHYDDMHPLYVNSEYIKAAMSPELVREEARYHLVLKP